jgi:hypothetical protein
MVQLVKLGPLGHPQCVAKCRSIFAFLLLEVVTFTVRVVPNPKKKRGNQSNLLLRCKILPLLIKYYIYPIETSKA